MRRPVERVILTLIGLLLGLMHSASVLGHGFEPALLDITQFEEKAYLVRWQPRQPSETSELAMLETLRLELPSHCQRKALPETGAGVLAAATGGEDIFSLHCDGHSLEGGEVRITGLAFNRMEAIVTVRFAGATVHRQILSGTRDTIRIPEQPSRLKLIRSFLAAGIEHILTGWDHLVFVLLVMMLVEGLRARIVAITAFSVGHSLSLAASTLGWISFPSRPVEVLIAWTLVFAAYSVVRNIKQEAAPIRGAWMVVGFIGLIHGLGFASALRDMGIPHGEVFWPLLSFNVGVELGQILVILSVVLTVRACRMLINRPTVWDRWTREILPGPLAYVFGSLAMYWVLERLTVF